MGRPGFDTRYQPLERSLARQSIRIGYGIRICSGDADLASESHVSCVFFFILVEESVEGGVAVDLGVLTRS